MSAKKACKSSRNLVDLLHFISGINIKNGLSKHTSKVSMIGEGAASGCFDGLAQQPYL